MRRAALALALLLGAAGAQHSGHTMPGMPMPMPAPSPGASAPVPLKPGGKVTPGPGGDTGGINIKMDMVLMGKQMVAALVPLKSKRSPRLRCVLVTAFFTSGMLGAQTTSKEGMANGILMWLAGRWPGATIVP